MEDVIFAGNLQRRALGMAEVTLTFDNADGSLATPFAEVAITRRAYRNGESEFFINQAPVRLRDITDLMLGTPLAAELAAIVSQGEIDGLLSAKPETRRELFEGVAGTARYRLRKREAQRRLEQTAANALRVNDLLTELEKQLPAIEQQVRRAKRYQKVQQQLRDFEIFSYVHRSAERREERARIAAELEAEERSAAESTHDHEALHDAAARARDEEYRATLALDERTAEHARLAHELETLAAQHATAAARLEECVRACDSLERESDEAAQTVAELEQRLVEATQALARARSERDRALAQAQAAATRETQAAASWEKAYAALRQAEEARAQQAAHAAQAAAAAEAAQAQCERLRSTLARLEEERSALERAQAEGAAALHACEESAHRIAREVEEAAKAREEAAARLTRASEELETARAAHQQAMAQLAACDARIEALREFVAGDAAQPEGARVLLAAAARGEVDGVLGTLGSLIEVDAADAKAIDALLGSHAGDVVVRGMKDARAALALLKEHRAGRACLLVLESFPRAERPAAAMVRRDGGTAREAAGLVRCAPEVFGALAQLLRGCWVVDDLDGALAAAQAAGEMTFATLDGDVIRGGCIATGAGSGVVAARSSQEALERQQAACREQAQHAAAQTDAAARRVDEARRALAEAETVLLRAMQRRQDNAAAQERQRAENERLARRAAEVEAEQAQAQTALREAGAEAERAQSTARDLAADVEALERQKHEALAESETCAESLRAVRDAHRAAAAEAAALVERVATAGDAVENLRNGLQRARARREERLAQLEQARGDLERARVQAAESAARRAQAQAELEALGKELETLRRARDTAAARARELEQQSTQADQAARSRSMELERRRIRLAEIDAELALLAQTFSQNPATPQECEEAAARCAGFTGDVDAHVRRLREEMIRLGNVNLNALDDRAATLERCEFLRSQLRDLEAARADIVRSIAEMDQESLRQFNETFAKVSVAFSETFTRLFNGGSARLWVCEAEDPTEAGIEIAAQPPGKKMQSLNALSGGERALTAVALIFATLQVRPSPFYIFDEIDAALDEANIGRFGAALRDLAGEGRSQIIIITHNKATMTLVDRMYGVTMSEPGVSSVLSLSLESAGAGR
jgi:chromosome segregation protein